jgi:O-antigen/teichoic acid export membrane protein
MALTVFISLYATRLTLSALGVTDFGLFNLVGGVISMLTFLNTAMSAATQRFMSFAEGAGDHQKQKEIFNVSTILHIIIAILVFLFLEIAGYFLFDKVLEIPVDRLETAKMIMQFMVVSTVFTIISVPYDAVINAHENMLLFAILGVIESVCKLGIAFVLSFTPYDKLTTYGLLMALLSIVLLFIRRIYCHRKYQECEIDFKKYFSKSTFKEMSSFAGWSFLGASSSMVANYGQGIVLNIFFGPVVNAAQAISNQISGQLGVFAGTMLKALNPLIAKSEGAGDRILMLKVSLKGSKFSFLLLLVFYIPVIIEMPFIFQMWLKDIPEYTLIFCKLLMIRNLIEQLYVTLSNSIAAVGKIRAFQITKSILTALPLGISYILFKFGAEPYSMYIVFIFYAILDAIVTLYFAEKYCGLSYRSFIKETLIPCLAIAMVTYFVSCLPYYCMQEGLIRLALVCALSLFFLIMVVWKWGLESVERTHITTNINKLWNKYFQNLYKSF